MSNMTKRFIAGAICPSCGLQDKTVVYTTEASSFSECVRCGYKAHATNNKEHKQENQSGKKKVVWLNKPE